MPTVMPAHSGEDVSGHVGDEWILLHEKCCRVDEESGWGHNLARSVHDMIDVLHQLREMVGFRAVCVCACTCVCACVCVQVVTDVAQQQVVLTLQVHTSEWKDL